MIKSPPSKLYIEPTTFCNFSCNMCVKQSPGSKIEEGELSWQVFQQLEPVFAGLSSLVFSGIGEPLLHPQLEKFIKKAHEMMPGESWIGLQTNGKLLTGSRIASLLDAGLESVCLSVDAASPESFRQIRSGGDIIEIENAISALKTARSERDKNRFRWGIEFVLMKKNAADMPSVLRWAGESGASFAIVTNVVPYSQALESEGVYSPNTSTSLDFYLQWKEKAQALGLDLDSYLKHRWKYHWMPHKSSSEKALADFGKQMLDDAYRLNIPLHLFNLIDTDITEQAEMKELLAEATRVSAETGLDLTLPELSPKLQRKCHFVEDGSLFVSWKGEVFPCYFLWHHYAFYQNGRRVKVTAKSLGDLSLQSIDNIWSGTEFRSFREKVQKYDYPFCENCNLGPCNLFTEKEFEYDCYVKDIPCGCCPWCGGLLHCL